MPQRRANILVVDDHAENLTALEAILAGSCDSLVKATSGTEALRHLLRQEFALVLMDAEMPRMNGFETVRLMRMRERSRYTPVIFLTAVNRNERYVAEGYSAGAVDYLMKPVMPDILRSKVIAFVDQFKKAEEIKEQASRLRVLNRQLEDANARMRELYGELAAVNDQLAVERDFVSKILQNAASLVMILDGAGRIIRFNKACELASGRSFDEARGQCIWEDFFRPVEFTAVRQSFESALAGVPVVEFEGTWVHRNGNERLIAWCFTGLSGKPPQADYTVATGMDITERHRAEVSRAEMIREQTARVEAEAGQRRFEFLAEASAALFSSLEEKEILEKAVTLAVPKVSDWCLIYTQTAPQSLAPVQAAHKDPETGLAVRELLGCPVEIDEDLPVCRAFRMGRSEILANLAPGALALPDGDNRHFALVRRLDVAAAVVVPTVAHGRVLGVLVYGLSDQGRKFGPASVSVAEHLAHRVALAIENAQLYYRAQESSNAKDQFLATVSHELRTPLNAMLGWTRLLRSGRLDAAGAARALETIERNARAQAQLVEDILDISRIVVGKLRLDFQRVEFAAVVEAALDTARPTAEIKNIRIESGLSGAAPVIMGDPNRLQQIVWNILSNAIKFTPPGGRVSLTLGVLNNRAELKVSDTGAGISPEFLPRIFDRFSQAEGSSARVHGGLGLGLSIVRHLVELHGGVIEAESPGPGAGATFTIRIPLRAVSVSTSSAVPDQAPTAVGPRYPAELR
jgi:PAS domain S-box-containing protein